MAFEDFIEAQFDPCPGYTFSSSPRWSTRIVSLTNGDESRNGNWRRALRSFKAPLFNVKQDVADAVWACFYATRGPLYGFRFKDWADFRADRTTLGLAPAGTASVQLSKYYAFGPTGYNRPIYKPVAGTVTVYQDSVAKAGSLDPTTGLFTPTTAWTEGAVLTWSGEFDVPVRFETDELPLTIDSASEGDYIYNGEVSLVEIRP
jgi:uncharacterized protein (TIGR02217 family)